MAEDFTAMGSAIASRFAAAAITPPSGYNDPGTATHEPPNNITSTPMAVVFPPTFTFSYGPHRRNGTWLYPVRWYIAPTADRPRAAKALNAWATVLIGQLVGKYELGLSPDVTTATVTAGRMGFERYGETADSPEYAVLDFEVTVQTSVGITPTT